MNNMVEKEDLTMKDLERSISRLGLVITAENLETDLFKLFLREEYSKIEDKDKLRIVLMIADNKLLEWHKDNYGDRLIESIGFETWKTKALEELKPNLSILEYLKDKRKMNEKMTDYFKRMERNGKKLKLKKGLILDVIRTNLTKHSFAVRSLIAGDRKFSDALYEKLRDLNAAIEEKGKFNSKKKATTETNKAKPFEKKKSVNAISCEEIINKDNSLYINDNSHKVLFDSGSEDNYVTRKIVEQHKLEIWTYKTPKTRYTCLQEPFQVKQFTRIAFTYKEENYLEEFKIFPKRNDKFIIAGREFINKVRTGKNNQTKPINKKLETIESLIEELCNNKNRKVEGYTCSIPTKPGIKVCGGTYMISHAEEKPIEDEIQRLQTLGYIRPSKS